MIVSEHNVRHQAAKLADKSPKEIIRTALEQHDAIAVSFSGAEDVVVIDLAVKIRPDVRVFTLDTGRLHAETYAYIEQVRSHYSLNLEVAFPDPSSVQRLVNEKGLFSFYQDGHQECCGVRKIEPLRRQLSGLDAWITGQRRDQSPSTRAQIDVVEVDSSVSAEHPLVKYNPLANWSSARVWEYIRLFDVPYNPLHAQGFVSIGCQPCTRPVLPHQHEREGRWWWEESTQKECGLHAVNLPKAANS